MIYFTNHELDQYLNEDLPYLDLTTHLQAIDNQAASLEVFTREDVIVACMEDACRMVEMLNCQVDFSVPSKQHAKAGEVLLKFSGDYNDVHKAWRSAQVLLEYSCKIASYSHAMKLAIAEVNQSCELLTTRKTFPFAKKFCIKAVITGGAMPHRLNISETIVFFSNHRIVYPTTQAFYDAIPSFKIKAPEKKIVIESETLEDAINLMQYGADVLQIDKLELGSLAEIVSYKNAHYPQVKVLAAGGINLSNVRAYAATGVDGIVTSSVYLCGMANLGTRMQLLG